MCHLHSTKHLLNPIGPGVYFERLRKLRFQKEFDNKIFTAALALRSRGLVIGSREKEEREREEREREEREREEKEEKNLQIAIRCLWDLFD